MITKQIKIIMLSEAVRETQNKFLSLEGLRAVRNRKKIGMHN